MAINAANGVGPKGAAAHRPMTPEERKAKMAAVRAAKQSKSN